MHSSSADWVFGLARLISSPTTTLAKTAPGRNSKSLPLLVVDAHAGDVAGQQVRGELDPAHRAVDRAGQRLGQHRLADAGHVLDQQVALGEQHGDGEPDDVGLAVDHGLHRGPDGTGRRGSAQRDRPARHQRSPGSCLSSFMSPPQSRSSAASPPASLSGVPESRQRRRQLLGPAPGADRRADPPLRPTVRATRRSQRPRPRRPDPARRGVASTSAGAVRARCRSRMRRRALHRSARSDQRVSCLDAGRQRAGLRLTVEGSGVLWGDWGGEGPPGGARPGTRAG